MHWRYVWNVLTAIILLCSTSVMQTLYWKFEYLWQLESPYPLKGGLPLFELAPIGLMLFTLVVAILAATYPLSQTKGRVVKICFGTTLLLICSVFPLIYLRYGIIPPLNTVDQIVTVIFFGIYFFALMAVICTIADYWKTEHQESPSR